MAENKDDELVLCVPTKVVTDIIGSATGFLTSRLELENLVTQAHDQKMYIPRGECETDENWLQIIPYVVYYSRREESSVLSYTRGKAITENRLAGKVSIGIGGHMNPEDGADYFSALLREQTEEIALPTILQDRKDFRLGGFLRLTFAPVDRVHLGVVHFVEVQPEMKEFFIVPPAEKEMLTDLQWRTPPELEAVMFRLEDWSVLVAQNMIRLSRP